MAVSSDCVDDGNVDNKSPQNLALEHLKVRSFNISAQAHSSRFFLSPYWQR
ncbi:hypothetical protein SAMN05216496_3594 [Pseudomonas sp. Z003-0.4C(8344-21)]|nr:hypothetical protein SAMN05216496_3594 [Pseudomonas sp. Z003-0.4C(8344-21)]